MNERTAYPLTWPDRRRRTVPRKTNHNFKTSFAMARDNCIKEIQLLGGNEVIISTNIRLKAGGIPAAVDWGKTIPDPGVAVYFKRNANDLCFACDCWTHVQDNMHAITLTIRALRGVARWGTGDMMEAAFTGFAALPAPGESGASSWWQTLGVTVNASRDQVREAYLILVQKHHPDKGGDAELFRRVQSAWEAFERFQK